MKDLLLGSLTETNTLGLIEACGLGLNDGWGHQEEEKVSEGLVHHEVVDGVVVLRVFGSQIEIFNPQVTL